MEAAPGPSTRPRPGSLEWLADLRPDEEVLLGPGPPLTRAAWEAWAAHLAGDLAAAGAGPGDLVVSSGEIGPAWHALAWAAAKLGAGLTAVPPLALPPSRAFTTPLSIPSAGSDPFGGAAGEWDASAA